MTSASRGYSDYRCLMHTRCFEFDKMFVCRASRHTRIHAPALQSLVLEQQHMIETLKGPLQLALRHQLGRRNERDGIAMTCVAAALRTGTSVDGPTNNFDDSIGAVASLNIPVARVCTFTAA